MDIPQKTTTPPTAASSDAVRCRIRPIRWSDWRELARLFRTIFSELSAADVSYFIRHHQETIAVAATAEGLIGFYQFLSRPKTGTAWLNYLGVIPSRTGDGIGTMLLRHFEERALEIGLRQAEFDVLQRNERGMRFYERHGYTRLYPVGDKFRYGKSLMDGSVVPARAAPPRGRSLISRAGRHALYFLLVTLPRRDEA